MAANATIDIYEKKIDMVGENDLKNQNQLILKDYINTSSFINDIIKLNDN